MGWAFLGSTSDIGDCPTLYGIEETGEVVVQGNASLTRSTSLSCGTSRSRRALSCCRASFSCASLPGWNRSGRSFRSLKLRVSSLTSNTPLGVWRPSGATALTG